MIFAAHSNALRRLLARPFWIATLVLTLLLAGSVTALAHPLGNFTTNRYSKLTLSDGHMELFYVVDMAEIPAYREQTAIDANGDGAVDADEQQAYRKQMETSLVEDLLLLAGEQRVPFEIKRSVLTFPPGQGGLKTLRLETWWTASLPVRRAWDLHYQDHSFAGRLGWQEIIIQANDSVELVESSVPSEDRSQALRVYPDDLLQNPLAVREAAVRFRPAATPSAGSLGLAPLNLGQGTAETVGKADPFADLIALPVDGPMTLLLTLLTAFVWGAAHALSPGHGKTIVAAYLVGSRGTARHALFLGLTTTATHTLGVFVLGFLTLFASRYILPEQLYPWLAVSSGLLVVGIGSTLVWSRLHPLIVRLLRRVDPTHEEEAHHHDHEHDHGHGHDHHDHHHHDGHMHSHLPPGAHGEPITWRSLLALGISGGLLPCPSALVVMLGAIALHRISFGLLLIVVFSVGLASVLTAIGILMVHAGTLVRYMPEGGRLLRLAPIASALFITLAGVGITVQALLQTGILPR